MMGAASPRVASGPGLLVASGALAIAASAQRWWPACRPGDFDASDCTGRQEHAYDLVIPTAPWTPVGNAAELYGVGLLLLAAAVLLLPELLLGRQPGRLLRVTTWLVALGTLVVATLTILSGVTGSAVRAPGDGVAGAMWALGLPVLVAAGVIECVTTERRGNGWRMAAAWALLLSTPIAQIIVTPTLLDYMSNDTTPWTEAVGGVGLVLAGAALFGAGGRKPTGLPRRAPAGLAQVPKPVRETPSVRREPA